MIRSGEGRGGKGRDGGEAVACRCAGARASERLPPRGRPAPPPRSLPRRLRPGRRARPRREPAASPARAGPGGREREAACPAPRRGRGREPLARAGPRGPRRARAAATPALGSARLGSPLEFRPRLRARGRHLDQTVTAPEPRRPRRNFPGWARSRAPVPPASPSECPAWTNPRPFFLFLVLACHKPPRFPDS